MTKAGSSATTLIERGRADVDSIEHATTASDPVPYGILDLLRSSGFFGTRGDRGLTWRCEDRPRRAIGIVDGLRRWGSMTLTIDPSKDYAVTSMISPSGTDWMRVHAADAVITADGVRHTFGSRSSGFSYTSVAIRDDGRHLELVVTFTLLPRNLNVTRHIAVVPGSPTFETWTSFEALGKPVMLSDIGGFKAVVAPGTLHWVTASRLRPATST